MKNSTKKNQQNPISTLGKEILKLWRRKDVFVTLTHTANREGYTEKQPEV